MELAHNRNELSPQGAQELAEVLDQLLADVQAYHQNIRTLLWDHGLKPYMQLNVSLNQLDQIVHSGENILAEEIIVLGQRPSSQPTTYLMKANIAPIEEVRGFDHAISTLVSGGKQILKSIHTVFQLAVELGEEHIEQLMEQIAKQVNWNISFYVQMRLAQWN